ncbi:hypothetical protein LSUCC0031_00210 [Rhodobacterales bacterium LSUCC0031]|nr:hypothetical protein [Rhodobacterales bacterium LSUCC0031]
MKHLSRLALILAIVARTAVDANPAAAQSVIALEIIDGRADQSISICCLSGVDFTSNGDIAIVSDKGVMFDARISDEVTSLTVTASHHLLNQGGSPLSRERSDAEGLAITPDGRMFISLERQHRIDEFRNRQTVQSWPIPRAIALPPNGGLEALAVDADGTLWTLSETPIRGGFPLLELRDGEWKERGSLPQSGRFLPVGADFDASGRLYILERSNQLWRFQSRIRRINIPTEDEKDIEILWESALGEYDNLEGIALLDNPTRDIHLLLVSDDNRMPLQTTQVLLLRLGDN